MITALRSASLSVPNHSAFHLTDNAAVLTSAVRIFVVFAVHLLGMMKVIDPGLAALEVWGWDPFGVPSPTNDLVAYSRATGPYRQRV